MVHLEASLVVVFFSCLIVVVVSALVVAPIFIVVLVVSVSEVAVAPFFAAVCVARVVLAVMGQLERHLPSEQESPEVHEPPIIHY
jgi:hypothetical protein